MASKPYIGKDFGKALMEAGIIPPMTRRAVIDAQIGHVVIIHLELIGDTRLLDVVPALKDGGVEIRHAGHAEPTDPLHERMYAAWWRTMRGLQGDGWRGDWEALDSQEREAWRAAAESVNG